MLNWHHRSIAAKLPLAIGALLTAVLSGLTLAAYFEVRRSSFAIARERLAVLTRQFAGTFEVLAQGRYAAMDRLARDGTLSECITAPGATTCELARMRLADHARTSPQMLALEIWDADGMRVLLQGQEVPPLAEADARSLASAAEATHSAALGDFSQLDDALIYRVVAPVSVDGRVTGYFAEVRRVATSSQTTRQLSEFLGSDARVLIGTQGGEWHDLVQRVPGPPPALIDTQGPHEYADASGTPMFGQAVQVAGSPWIVVVEFPLSNVLTPAQRFVQRAVPLSLLFVALGVFGGWFISRRLTKPLAVVTRAAESIAAGRTVPHIETDRSDELGRLETSFNTMADEVEEARARLQRLAAHYRLLFDASPQPMWVSDAESGRFLNVNEAAVERYGFTRDEFLALAVADIAAPPDGPAETQVGALESAARLVKHRRKDGRVIDVEIRQQALQLDGRAAQLTLATDVTERLAAARSLRASEAALRRSEQNLATTLDSIGDAVIATDLGGRIVRMNPVAERLTGWPVTAARGRQLTDVYSTLDEHGRAPRANPVERVYREGGFASAGRHSLLIARDGSERLIADSAAQIRDPEGCLAGVVLVFRDISAEREAERALRDNQLRKSAVLSAALDAIVTMDVHGAILEFNPAAERTFGLTAAQALGKPLADLLVPADLRDSHRAGVARYLATGVSKLLGQRLELRALRADGTEFPAEVSIVRTGTPDAPEFTGFIRDVSARKHLEAQLRQSQKMEAIGRLAGGVAHDFNNLISIVVGYCDLLIGEAGGAHRPELAEIRAAGLRAADLTRQLLAFSRQQVLQPRFIDLAQIVAGMDRMLRRVIGEDVELTVRAQPALTPVHADPGQVEQIVMNLVVNARDAMPLGGKLGIELADAELDDSYAAEHAEVTPGRYVMLAVTDNGTGMDAATRARIFEPFFTTKEKGKGTGLGLSTVLGIVQQSGGTIWVYSELGQGTTFKVYLPAAAPGAVAESAPLPAADAHARHGVETILLVEDDEHVRSLVHRILQKHGYRVLEASGGDEALVICERQGGQIDLVVTDVIMPHISGRQLVERLRVQHPGLKVLYMSGYTDDAIIQHGVLEPGVAFVQKPFTPPVLARKVRETLESS